MDRQKMCENKVAYTKKDAQTVRNRRQGQGEKHLRIYQYPLCNYWHLTKQYSNEEKKNKFGKNNYKRFI